MLGAPPLYVLLLSALVILTYLVALWRLLRNESRPAVLALLALAAFATALRWYDFPPLHVDEGLTLECTSDDDVSGRRFDDNCNKLPSLIQMLFELPLVHVFGPDVVAIRAYSFLGSVASVAVLFALERFYAAFTVKPGSQLHIRMAEAGDLRTEMWVLAPEGKRLPYWRETQLPCDSSK